MDEEVKDVVEETAENIGAQPTEENEDGIELTDTTKTETPVEEKEEEKPQGRYVTDDELNELVNKRVARKMSKLERENESKLADYRETEAILNAGLGTSNIKDANAKMREFYTKEGLKMPEPVKPGYSKHDIEVLAKAEASEIIDDGYDAMLEEANKLAQKGYANMDDREKVIFTTLGAKLNEENDKRELLKLGASEDFLKDEDFTSFRKKYSNNNTPIKDVYELYMKNQPKKQVDNPGSMKNNSSKQTKTTFTNEEIAKMTDKELEENWDAIRKYQTSGTI